MKLKETLGKSAIGIKWQQKQYDERIAMALSQKSEGVSKILGRMLAAKKVSLDNCYDFLNPTIKSSLPDPFLLLDMEIAAKRIIQNIKDGGKIVIFGDYDVDGATSSSLLKRFLKMTGNQAQIYIPDRIVEGYGPNSQALLKIKDQGADLVITVDCGTVSFEPLEAAHNAGLDVIVIDHHLGTTEKPKAIAIVNPNRLDETFEHKNLAAVGVAFLLCVAINKLLKEEGFYQKQNISEPKLLSLLDLVALGTVCDVVPLTGVNRAFVSQGLKIMKNRSNLGLRTLCDIANLDQEPTSYHLGYVLGPRINAGGRVGQSDLGATLLSNDNDEEGAKRIASNLDIHNKQRKDIEKTALEEALIQIEKTGAHKSPVIFASSNKWHPGVIGIVASRIKEVYNKPTAIVAIKDGIGKASCRSIYGVDFGSSIVKARLEELAVAGGGHAMAAGFTVEESKIEELHKFLCDELEEAVNLNCQEKVSEFTDIIDITNANINLAREINMLEPFGAGNSKPKFIIRDLLITKADAIGADKKHVRCTFSSKSISGWTGYLNGIAFSAMENNIGPLLISKNKGQTVSAVGQININSWMGNQNVQILIEDILY